MANEKKKPVTHYITKKTLQIKRYACGVSVKSKGSFSALKGWITCHNCRRTKVFREK